MKQNYPTLTVNQLIEAVAAAGFNQLSNNALSIFADRKSNFKIPARTVLVKPTRGIAMMCYALMRKQTVKSGRSETSYFNAVTFERVYGYEMTAINTMSTKKLTNMYILDCIDNSMYSEMTLTTAIQKLDFLKSTFEAEYDHMIKRLGYMDALASWLSGAPSSINIALYYPEIIKVAVELEYIPIKHTDKQYSAVVAGWFDFMAGNIMEMFNGLFIPE